MSMNKNPIEVVKALPPSYVKGAVADVLAWRRTGLLPAACRLRDIANDIGVGGPDDEFLLRRAEDAVMTVAASRWAGLID